MPTTHRPHFLRPGRTTPLARTLLALGVGHVPVAEADESSFIPHTIQVEHGSSWDSLPVDMDGDGDLDIAAVQNGNSRVVWFDNTGDQDGDGFPEFEYHLAALQVSAPTSVHAEDMDGDGDIDLLAHAQNGWQLWWIENEPGSSDAHDTDGVDDWTKHLVMEGARRPTAVFAADLDRDGDADMLSSTQWDGSIRWWENDGSANPVFSEHIVTDALYNPTDVYAADVDDDGDLDVLAVSQNDHALTWFENDGSADPTFTAHTVSTGVHRAQAVRTADIDGDGDTDLLATAPGDDTVWWFEHLEGTPPTFVPHVVTDAMGQAFTVEPFDRDLDGDIDLLVAGLDGTVAWMDHDGANPPNFKAIEVVQLDHAAMDASAGDADGDGDIDVLVSTNARGGAAAITWYETPGFPDADGDGIADMDDNCVLHANDDQADDDDNGIGDACEPREAPDAEAGDTGLGWEDAPQEDEGYADEDFRDEPEIAVDTGLFGDSVTIEIGMGRPTTASVALTSCSQAAGILPNLASCLVVWGLARRVRRNPAV